jgi:hypothetical protein
LVAVVLEERPPEQSEQTATHHHFRQFQQPVEAAEVEQTLHRLVAALAQTAVPAVAAQSAEAQQVRMPVVLVFRVKEAQAANPRQHQTFGTGRVAVAVKPPQVETAVTRDRQAQAEQDKPQRSPERRSPTQAVVAEPSWFTLRRLAVLVEAEQQGTTPQVLAEPGRQAQQTEVAEVVAASQVPTSEPHSQGETADQESSYCATRGPTRPLELV